MYHLLLVCFLIAAFLKLKFGPLVYQHSSVKIYKYKNINFLITVYATA